MLEMMIQRFRGIVSYAMLLLLAAVFLVTFGGPQEWNCKSRLNAANVYGNSISPGDLDAAFMLAGGENYPSELAEQYKLKPMLLQGLVERSLLAREARRIGMHTDEDEVLERVADDGVIHLSMSVDAQGFLPPSGPMRLKFTDSDGKFSKENLKNFIQYRLRRSVKEFAHSQVEETLAQRMRDAVMANAAVGDGEVWDAYVREKESVTLKYARFMPVYYAGLSKPSEAELAAWMASNAKDVDAEYERQKHRYTGLEKQVRARHVLVKVASDATEADKVIARAKAQDILDRARKGEDFATLARAYSEDEGSAKNGGDLGFNPKGRMLAPFDEAQFALAPGALSDLVETAYGLHVIKVEAVREGDVPVAEAKREIAEKLERERSGAARAEAAARALHAKLAAGMTIDEAEAWLAAGGSAGAQAAAAAASAKPTKPAKHKQGDAEAEGEPEPPPESDPLAPAFRDTAPFGRTDTPIPGPFDASALVRAAFELTDEKPVPEPMKLGDEWFVVRLAKRENAVRESFAAEDKQRLRNSIAERRRREILVEYVHSLRRAAEEAGEIMIEPEFLSGAPPAAPAPE